MRSRSVVPLTFQNQRGRRFVCTVYKRQVVLWRLAEREKRVYAN